MLRRHGKSPYRRYNKRPYDYSGMYRRLIEAHRARGLPFLDHRGEWRLRGGTSELAAHLIRQGWDR